MSGAELGWRVVVTRGFGRGAEATRAFARGELVHRETAFAVALDADLRRLRCPTCLAPRDPDTTCCAEDAVDALLREAGPDLARVAADQRIGQRLLHLALRLLARCGTPRRPHARAPVASPDDALSLLAPLDRHPPVIVGRLEAAGRQLGPWLARIGATPDDLAEACARVDANAFALGAATDPSERLGMAVAPRAALFNHSCAPNCLVSNDGPVYSVRALRPIEPGEALTVTYVGLYETRAARRAELLDDHLFVCGCGRCTGVDADAEEIEGHALDVLLGAHRCGACGRGAHPARPDGWGPCAGCGAALDADAARAAESALRERLQALDLPDDKVARRDLLLRCLDEVEAVLPPHHPVVFRLRWTLARTLGELGHTAERLALTRRLAAHAARMLPAGSLEMAQVHHALGDATARRMTAADVTAPERRALHEEAKAALNAWRVTLAGACGPDHPATRAALRSLSDDAVPGAGQGA